MTKTIILALIATLSITGTAIAKGQGQGGQGGQGGNGGGDNGPEMRAIRVIDADVVIIRRSPNYPLLPRIKPEHCHNGGEVAATNNECGHYSR